MTKLEVGKIYKTRGGEEVIIISVDASNEMMLKFHVDHAQGEKALGYYMGHGDYRGSYRAYHLNGTFLYNYPAIQDIIFDTKTITIYGKDIEISEESFNELKRSLSNGKCNSRENNR